MKKKITVSRGNYIYGVCLYVYVCEREHCVNECVNVWVHMCVHECVCERARNHVCAQVCISVYVWMCVHVCVYVIVHPWVCIYVCVYVHPHVCMCEYVCMCTWMHTLTCIIACTFMWACMHLCLHVEDQGWPQLSFFQMPFTLFFEAVSLTLAWNSCTGLDTGQWASGISCLCLLSAAYKYVPQRPAFWAGSEDLTWIPMLTWQGFYLLSGPNPWCLFDRNALLLWLLRHLYLQLWLTLFSLLCSGLKRQSSVV